ncbi:OPT/YSL family transporter, partial [Agriterribacter sp.]|uniref:OPT/YSL family transporter n=1 Tax=Agriterribacter sp. TaxID=2821509 RepID=UPI002BE6D4F6
ALSFAIGLYLPLATTLPIFIGGAIRGIVDWQAKRKGEVLQPGEEDLGKGNLFATGLVAGGAIAGVVVAFLSANDAILNGLKKLSFEHGITSVLGGALGYELLGVLFFAALGGLLYKVAKSK